nr:meiotic recombination protein SPO11-like [Procambarus clarkii]
MGNREDIRAGSEDAVTALVVAGNIDAVLRVTGDDFAVPGNAEDVVAVPGVMKTESGDGGGGTMAVSEEFWHEIEKFRLIILRDVEGCDSLDAVATGGEDVSREMLAACERIVEDVVASISVGEPPVLRVPRPPRRGGSGTGGESLVSLGASRSTRRFTHLIHTLAQAYRHVASGTYATRRKDDQGPVDSNSLEVEERANVLAAEGAKGNQVKTGQSHLFCRDVYYESVWLYQSQAALDRSAEDLTRVLGVPRRGLHLTITGKGLVAGDLTYTTHDGTIVCVSHTQNGMLVPESVEGLTRVVSQARYILVVEKDATFQRLVEAQVHRTFGPAILLTGKGYPDVSTRQLLHRLWRELRVPVLALTDADPYGLHIAAVYKFGALAREDPGLAVSSLAWLGILPTDLPALQLPPHALLPLTPTDHGKLASLAAHPALSRSPAWLTQIHEQQESGYKAEIQSLTHINPDYLTSVYLPTKLRQAGWVL